MSEKRTWTTRGFDGFRKGTMGNAGQNVYVSRAGVLQRIHQFDLDQDGHIDLVICNSQPHGEQPPSYVYRDPLGEAIRTDLPSDGAWAGTVADFNGDGYDDLVIGMTNNGARGDLNAVLYYGSPDGFSERRHMLLPAPWCTSVASGDFNGDGLPDLAFVCRWYKRGSDTFVRLFYQSGLAFESKRFVDLDIAASQLAAADLDGDGHAELVVRMEDGEVRVYWGGPDGIDAGRFDTVQVGMDTSPLTPEQQAHDELYSEYNKDARPLAQVVTLNGVPHVFVARHRSASFVPVTNDRSFGRPLVLECQRAMSVAVGDVNGDGIDDIVVVCRELHDESECSWVYWGSETGYDESRRTRLPSMRACDVAVADLDGDGYDDIVLCQCHTQESFTRDALVYRGSVDGVTDEPVRLQIEDSRRVLLVRRPEASTPDLAFVNHYSGNIFKVNPAIYYGGPDGFSPERRDEVPGFGAVEALPCDLNDDGLVDLVVANSSHNSTSRDPGSYVILRGSKGYPDKPTQTLPTVQCHGVCAADLNRDGYLDLLFPYSGLQRALPGNRDPYLRIYYGGPNGFDPENPELILMERDGVVSDSTMWPYLADLNNDGWLDLVAPQHISDRSFVLWGGPEGFSMERSQALSVHKAGCARAADLTGNGYLDLILGGSRATPDVPNDSFVWVYWNGPEGLREDRKTLLPASTTLSMSVADFNNDGTLDLFVGCYKGLLERDLDSYIYWNRKDRGFSARDRTRLFTHSASGCVAADFNEDGWIDLAIANHKVFGEQVAYSEVWWNGPEGFVKDRATRLPSAGPHGMTSVEPGNIMDRGPEEFYTSAPFQLPEVSRVTRIAWDADLGPRTWVKAQLRTAETSDRLDESVWVGPVGDDGWYHNNQQVEVVGQGGRWVQYRLALGAVNSGSTPRVTAVDVHYETR